MSNLNEMQQLRSDLVKEVACDVEKAKKVWDFVIGHEETKPQISTKENSEIPRKNGIYYILAGGIPVHESVFSENEKDDCIGVGIVMGDKFATVSLNDVANGDDVALVDDSKDYSGNPERYKRSFWDAMYDWDGQGNTESMRGYLNPQIELESFEYIPSVAQLHLILMNIKEINQALENVGGTPLSDNCYWSSTEGSSNSSWYVTFSSGNAWGASKFDSNTVRPSVACEL